MFILLQCYLLLLLIAVMFPLKAQVGHNPGKT
ncbi:hypothetical protein FHW36_108141 [Chitinophaga polysaccharea]|uniref:Uncharacterized protein n=1 Tax=Chitinophaga polysaccharea TaxID=1293035 RepID=A0A561PCD9_9BACT|nr:hypothetical protein FHW36_108141 [Chitinophaga polysaccharea]